MLASPDRPADYLRSLGRGRGSRSSSRSSTPTVGRIDRSRSPLHRTVNTSAASASTASSAAPAFRDAETNTSSASSISKMSVADTDAVFSTPQQQQVPSNTMEALNLLAAQLRQERKEDMALMRQQALENGEKLDKILAGFNERLNDVERARAAYASTARL